MLVPSQRWKQWMVIESFEEKQGFWMSGRRAALKLKQKERMKEAQGKPRVRGWPRMAKMAP